MSIRVARLSILAVAILLILGISTTSQPAWAAAGGWSANDASRVRLVSASDTVGDGTLRAGVHFQLAPGWKTYWRSPGDAGYPMSIDWSGSSNVRNVDVAWPAPERFTLFDMDTFGYHDEVVFPLRVEAVSPDQPIHLVGEVDYLLCSNICVPHKQNVSLTLPPGAASGASQENLLIDRFETQVPKDEDTSGIRLESFALAGEGETLRLEGKAVSAQGFSMALDILVEGPSGAYFARPDVVFSGDRTEASFVIPLTIRDGMEGIEGSEVTLTLVDGGRGLEVGQTLSRLGAPVTEASGSLGAPVAEASSAGLLAMLGVALLGGLILNLMPCVLPVLSIKLMSFVSHSESSERQVRLSFLATSAGILFSFMLLAGGLIALKSAGAMIGWGIQFQQPVFLAFMAVVVTLFAANLLGFFEITLPGRVADRVSGTGSQGLSGSFATGAFTTLLATPCSAPFLGTAVTFALSRGAGEIALIFAALGLGLALPQLLIAAFPRLARLMPRPGRWMVWLRYVMAAALAATAIWLLSVLSVQIGLQAAIFLALLLAALVVLFGIRRFLWTQMPAIRSFSAALGVAALAVAGLASPQEAPVAHSHEGPWHDCQRELIDEAVAQGQTVVIDVTADWCITCQINKMRVLENEKVEELIDDKSVLAMRADWTRPSDKISDFLSDHGRYGIPFNVVYGPGAPDGIPLPELLTVDAVAKAMEEARGS